MDISHTISLGGTQLEVLDRLVEERGDNVLDELRLTQFDGDVRCQASAGGHEYMDVTITPEGEVIEDGPDA